MDTLLDVLHHRADHTPDRPAVTFLADGVQALGARTYRGLYDDARGLAAQLQDRVRPGDRVVLLYPPGLDFTRAFFATVLAGGIPVPAASPASARPERSLAQLNAIARDARPALVLTTEKTADHIAARFQQHLDPRLGTFAALPADGRADAAHYRRPDIKPDDLGLLQYTSGSTSAPKGVEVTHHNLLANIHLITKVIYDLDENDVGVTWLPHHHDMGLIEGILEAVVCGFPIYLLSPLTFLRDPRSWLRAIDAYKCTKTSTPNFGMALCVKRIPAEERAGFDLSTMRCVCIGAEPIRFDTLTRFADAFAPAGFRREALCPAFGLAEHTVGVCSSPIGEVPEQIFVDRQKLLYGTLALVDAAHPDAQSVVALGPIPDGVEAAIVDPDTCAPCPPDRVGEIWLKGASNARGYRNQPRESARTFQATTTDGRGPFMRTGDLGFLHEGQLFVGARIKDLIIIHGANYYPQDFEVAAEGAHPSLRVGCAAAFGVDGPGGDEVVLINEVERRSRDRRAAAEPPAEPPEQRSGSDRRQQEATPALWDAPGSLDADEAIAATRQAVENELGIPLKRVVLIRAGSLPKTTSGKVQRQKCRQLFLDRALDVVAEG